MEKYIKYLFLIFALLSVPLSARAKALPLKTFRIYMALWNGKEEAARGFEEYLYERKLPFKLIVRDAKQNMDNVFEMVKEVKEIKPDLLVTWGSAVSLGMLGTYHHADSKKFITDIPAVFMVVSQPIATGLVPNMLSSGRNITGAMHLVAADKQLAIARKYIEFKRLGVVYNPLENSSKLAVARLRPLIQAFGAELVELPLALNEGGVEPASKSIEDALDRAVTTEVDLIYQGPDAWLNKNRDSFTQAALLRRLPVFSVSENSVRQSQALFGVTNRYYNVGQLAAQKALRILKNGEYPKDIVIEEPKRHNIIVNMDVASKLYMYPPVGLLRFSEIIGGK